MGVLCYSHNFMCVLCKKNLQHSLLWICHLWKIATINMLHFCLFTYTKLSMYLLIFCRPKLGTNIPGFECLSDIIIYNPRPPFQKCSAGVFDFLVICIWQNCLVFNVSRNKIMGKNLRRRRIKCKIAGVFVWWWRQFFKSPPPFINAHDISTHTHTHILRPVAADRGWYKCFNQKPYTWELSGKHDS